MLERGACGFSKRGEIAKVRGEVGVNKHLMKNLGEIWLEVAIRDNGVSEIRNFEARPVF